jgi:uncharacterized membrane protein
MQVFLNAPFVVQLHAGAAMAAFLLGLAQFALPKGGGRHRAMGYAWVGLMLAVALSSFGIVGGTGRYSWIHLISVYTLLTLPVAVLHARRGRIMSHRWQMIGMFLGALVITGAFTLLPGRLMHQVVFG